MPYWFDVYFPPLPTDNFLDGFGVAVRLGLVLILGYSWG